MAKLEIGSNDLKTLYPNLIKEWDFNNNKKDPSFYMPGSSYRAWWICPKCNASWQGRISHRTSNNSSCPYCSNRLARAGINDLFTMRPDLVKEWDYQNNKNLDPKHVTYSSTKNVWWICPKGHSYKMQITQRTKRMMNCPICSGHRILTGFNDLSTVRPDLAKEWHPTMNGALSPTQVGIGSHKKVYWLCDRGHFYPCQVKNRVHGTGCPFCDKERQTSFPEQAILFYLSKQVKALNRYKIDEFEVDIYLPDLKIGIEYDGVFYHSSEKAKAKELRKNSYLGALGIKLIRIKEIARKQKTYMEGNTIFYSYSDSKYRNINEPIELLFKSICIEPKFIIDPIKDSIKINSNFLSIEKEKSIVSMHPEIASEWDYEKNQNIDPRFISYSSNKDVYWICPRGHSYHASPSHRIRGHGCPYCSGHQVMPGFNDIATTHPSLLKEWDYTKNNILPSQVSFGSEIKINWICEKGHSYSMMICSRVKGGSCPFCSGHKVMPGFNDLVTTHKQILIDWDYDKNTIKPSEITKGSKTLIYWKCHKCGYEYQSAVYNKIKGKKCPYCANKIIIKGKNDFESGFPELALDWDEKLNGKKACEMSRKNGKSFYWKCHKCGFIWKNSIWNRIHGQGCPYCKKQKTS